MLRFHHGGQAAYDTVLLSPQDWNVRERRETSWVPELTIRIRLGDREFVILDHGKHQPS